MSFGEIIGQLLQQGMAGQTQTQNRLRQSAAQGGGGLDQILGSLLGGGAGLGGGGGRSAGGSSMGGLAELAESFLRQPQVGGMSGAQVGGLGALVGAMLGGGGGAMRGAAGGGAMAILGTLALSALKNYQAQAAAGTPPQIAPEEVQAVTDPATEQLVLEAMVTAAKADGQIDQHEMQRLVDHLEKDGVSEEERQFVVGLMRKPIDLADLAGRVRSPAVAAELYAASLLAIDIDTEAERAYLRQLAQALRLDPGTVVRLHQMTGAPAV